MKVLGQHGYGKNILRDLISLGAFALFLSYFLVSYDVSEKFYEFSRMHENWELDEACLLLATVLPLCLAFFSMSRWNDCHALLKQANTDVLTGLFNRRKGREIIEEEVMRSTRYDGPLSLIIFDLDYFKRINDTYGHLVGDEVLKEVSTVAGKLIRNIDSLIRWGGEEFVVVCPGTDSDGAGQLAERIRQGIAKNEQTDIPKVTASFGVGQLQRSDDFFTLINAVDKNLYLAKKGGRNIVVS